MSRSLPNLRSTVDALLSEARVDRNLLERLRQDPAAVLVSAGIDPESARQASLEVALPDEDVVGLRICLPGDSCILWDSVIDCSVFFTE